MNSPRSERADVFAQVIERKQIPFAVDVREMVRIDHARLDVLPSGLAVGDLHLLMPGCGFCQVVEDFQIQNLLGACTK